MLILLVIVPITPFLLLLAIGSLRIYHRTKMTSRLLFAIGYFLGITAAIIILPYLLYGEGEFYTYLILFRIVAIATAIILGMAFALETTKESGAWKEICDQTTIWQRIVGSVPNIEKEKHPSIFSKQSGLILGIFLSIVGAVGLLSSLIFDACNKIIPKMTFGSFSILSLGLFLILFSLKQK